MFAKVFAKVLTKVLVNVMLDDVLSGEYLHSNHLKFSGLVFRNLLSKLLNSFLLHGFLPENMLNGQIEPRIKSNLLSKKSSNNYRPVMSSSNFFKIFEYIMLPYVKRHLVTDVHQFGYRTGTSCLSAITLIKETILYYKNNKSNVFLATIDLSKAFDTVNINLLISKLRISTLPANIVDILQYMYGNAYVRVKFNHVVGDLWKIGR